LNNYENRNENLDIKRFFLKKNLIFIYFLEMKGDKFSIFTSNMKLQNEEIKNGVAKIKGNHVDEPEGTFIGKLAPNIQELRKKTNDLRSSYIDLMKNPKWKQIEKKGNFTSYSMEGDEGLIYIKSEGIIDCTPIEVTGFLRIHEHKAMFDKNFQKGMKLQEIPNNMSIFYERFNGKLIFSDRDVVFIGAVYLNFNDGSIQIIATDAPNFYPDENDAVRASIKIAGYYLIPEGNKTKAVYINYTNLKGNIPNFIASMAAENQGTIIPRIDEAIKTLCKS